jgi:LuxR family maltose regulon positive regulatory protein
VAEQQIHDALMFLVDHLPHHMHLVLSTRSDPPWQFARLRALREMTELRAHDLRFTPEEAADFLNSVMGSALSAESISLLDIRTKGWIAGLQLAALALQGSLSMQGRDTESFVMAFSG